MKKCDLNTYVILKHDVSDLIRRLQKTEKIIREKYMDARKASYDTELLSAFFYGFYMSNDRNTKGFDVWRPEGGEELLVSIRGLTANGLILKSMKDTGSSRDPKKFREALDKMWEKISPLDGLIVVDLTKFPEWRFIPLFGERFEKLKRFIQFGDIKEYKNIMTMQGMGYRKFLNEFGLGSRGCTESVSYTHLTLPTSDLV